MMIERPLYVDKIMAYVDTPFVKSFVLENPILKMIMETENGTKHPGRSHYKLLVLFLDEVQENQGMGKDC